MTWGDSLPRNFSWLRVGRIAGSACPSSELELRSLLGVGIKHVISLSPETPPHASVGSIKDFCWTPVPIQEFQGASVAQFQRFFDVCESAVERGEAILVHCRGGRGRTGMMLAAFLIKFEEMSVNDAVQAVRALRPQSIETRSQTASLNDLKCYLDASGCYELL